MPQQLPSGELHLKRITGVTVRRASVDSEHRSSLINCGIELRAAFFPILFGYFRFFP